MPKATFIAASDRVEVDVPLGETLMRAARSHGVDAIFGDCGGELACATCHVFVSPDYIDKLPDMSEAEREMLECAAAERRVGSRLSCQITMTEQLSDIVVEVADPQG